MAGPPAIVVSAFKIFGAAWTMLAGCLSRTTPPPVKAVLIEVSALVIFDWASRERPGSAQT
jgi:hypothetical protein